MEERGIAVVVEDDDDVRHSLREVLLQSGFSVYATSSGLEGVEAVRRYNPVVVTMDLGLPDFDGLEASRRIRTFSDAYLVIVTGRVDEADAIMGFEAGADDFLTKPFRPRELRARIAAMLRRPRQAVEAAVPAGDLRGAPAGPAVPTRPAGMVQVGPRERDRSGSDLAEFEHNGLTLSEGTRTAEFEGTRVELTRTQFDLLLVLLENGRLVQTKADLVRRLRNEPYDTGSYVSTAEERAVEVHMGNLRKRLGDDSRAPRWVETVRGIGYRLAPQLAAG
ncbi:DNA-binding response OmpR family regulator [Arthrobacter sp. PvP102]|uniref:response regulator transcription factor n=1 Tax=unclassified Arthrobacter TaxID=235627 RepID=UPI001AE26316|nr:MULTISPECIES: response regulator transcription factor [unclassified Arthrobacter]MBP1232840.1 DNA-binding response OmpR family regulator [Arthrobacter sp. PvP103]MBP1237975.1 DNA-binding response OmpR family regulator [Arthrobacter sp. PvP102]